MTKITRLIKNINKIMIKIKVIKAIKVTIITVNHKDKNIFLFLKNKFKEQTKYQMILLVKISQIKISLNNKQKNTKRAHLNSKLSKKYKIIKKISKLIKSMRNSMKFHKNMKKIKISTNKMDKNRTSISN
jgi:hypothetical protein